MITRRGILAIAALFVVGFLPIDLAMRSASAGPQVGSQLWQLQQAQKQELSALQDRFRSRGNLPGAAQNQAYQEQLRQEYSDKATDIKQKYLQSDTRPQMINDAVETYGYKNADGSFQRDPKTGKIVGDIEVTGSAPKDVRADVDLNAKTHEAADSLAKSWQDQDHKVTTYPHKYVDETTDTTLWRPCDTPECLAAKAKDLDAWTTEGGLQGTGNAGRIRDPKGYYLDNEKKFIHGQEMVKGGDFDEGLKTAAKSLDKPAIYAGMRPENSADIVDPAERKFWQQAESLRAYGDPVDAGIANPSDSPEVINNKVKAWLSNDAEGRMLTAKQKLSSWGDAVEQARLDAQNSLAKSNPADPENRRMNELGAKAVQDEIKKVREFERDCGGGEPATGWHWRGSAGRGHGRQELGRSHQGHSGERRCRELKSLASAIEQGAERADLRQTAGPHRPRVHGQGPLSERR